MNGVLDGLVLDGQDLDPLHDLVEEELAEDVVWDAAHAFLAAETEVYPVFHHKEALLAL